MFTLSIMLLCWSTFQIYYTLDVLHTGYINRKFNEQYGLEFYEDIDDYFTESSSDDEQVQKKQKLN